MANTAPSFSLGQVPSVSDWQGYFNAKVDASGGTLTNGTITGTCPGTPTWTGLHTFNAGISVASIISAALAASPSYDNDTQSAAGGVPLNGFYRNGNFVMIRVA